MKLEFRELTSDTWEQCAKLTDIDCEYIAPNTYSIAEAQFYPKAVSRAIYVDGLMVGYTMYGEDEDDADVWAIDRFMIAKDFRNRGYAQAAIEAIVQNGREQGFRKIVTSTKELNQPMRNLLTKLGFETKLEFKDGEIVYFIEDV